MRIISSQDLFESYMSDLDEATAMGKRFGPQREAEIRQQLTARSNAPGTGSRHIDNTIAAAKREQERYVHRGRGESPEDFNKRVRNRATTYRNLGIKRRESVRDSDRNYLRYSSTYGKKIKLTPEQQHLSNVRGELRMAGTFTPRERQNLDPSTKKRYQIKDEFELWVNSLVNEGYDLSEYTWDDAYEIYETYSDYLTVQAFLIGEGYADSIQESDYMIENMDEDLIEEIIYEAEGSYGRTPKAEKAFRNLYVTRHNTDSKYFRHKGGKLKSVEAARRHVIRFNDPDTGHTGRKSPRPTDMTYRRGLTKDERDIARQVHTGYADPDDVYYGPLPDGPKGSLPKGKKLARQRKTGVSK